MRNIFDFFPPLIFHFPFSTFNFLHSACGLHVENDCHYDEHDKYGTDSGSTAATTIGRGWRSVTVISTSVTAGMVMRRRRRRRRSVSAATMRRRRRSVTAAGRGGRSVSTAHRRSWRSVHKKTPFKKIYWFLRKICSACLPLRRISFLRLSRLSNFFSGLMYSISLTSMSSS